MVRKRPYKKSKGRGRRRVPGWGGAAGRLAGVGMKYVSKGGMAYKALRLAKKVANAVNVEYKHLDTSSGSVTPDYAGSSVTLNNPPQGSTDQTRIGDSIKNQNLVLRGTVQASTTTPFSNLVRLILIWDDQNQYSTLSDLLENTGSSVSVYSPKNYDRRFRNRVIWDRLFVVNTYNQFVIPFDETFNIDQHTQFSAGTTTQFTGSLKLIMLSDRTATALPQVAYYARLTYTDD